ncbi:MAG: cobalamin biosynthesis protein CbiM [Dorea sp.]|jgi:cobalt/nickel transport system permease protein|nr:cobalamin biosynthesis protein CbiM [Dorea sp.]MCI9454803.1 cobalamin biosynthesis protein CbiM [Dorea sp.]
MHMADALVSPAVAGTMYAMSAAAAAYAVKKIRLDDLEQKVPMMGVMGAFVFAGQMINFTIPGTGSSGHLCGGMLLSAVMGPYAGFLTMIAILAIQCLLFADGGLLALGCNVWNMAFYGCFVGGAIIWRVMTGKRMTKGRIAAASVLGCVLSLQLGAFSVTIETLISGITELPFPVFLGMMQPIHLAIGLVEGLITAAVLVFVYEARPEILYGYRREMGAKGRMSRKRTAIVLAVLALVIGGVVSLFASASPDGLEWSMEKVAGTTELLADGRLYELAEKVQGLTALLPDYGFQASESAAGTSFSGIVGGVAVLAVCLSVCLAIKRAKQAELKKRNAVNESN